MRVELYGCPYSGGLVSYSMPQGDRRGGGSSSSSGGNRGGAYEFYDYSYDGEWRARDNR